MESQEMMDTSENHILKNSQSELEQHQQSDTDSDETNSSTRKCILGWGSTVNGELGLGGIEEDSVDTPTKIKFTRKIKSVACGESHTVFILEDGTLWSCGCNDHGQLGHDKCRTRPEQVEEFSGRQIVSVSAGYAHNLAIDSWGTLFSWGSNSHGQLGQQLETTDDKLVNRPKIVKSMATKTVVQVAAGFFHSVVLTNSGEIYTCGSNSHGQLGLGYANGPNQTKFCLVELLVGLPTIMVTAGGFHSFALSVSGSVFGWGKNNSGQLGVGDTDDKCQPTQLATLRSLGVTYITAGADHTAFLTQDGGLFSAGHGTYGQLGHGSSSNEVLPRKILEFGRVVTQVACGRCHTLCWTNDKLYTFGLNSSGQLGISGGNRNTPFHVKTLSCVVNSIYAGGDHSIVLVDPVEVNAFETSVPNAQPALSVDYRESATEKAILTITEDFVTQMCSSSEPVDQDIMTLTEILFAAPACWNASFLLPDREHAPCTWKNMGVNLDLAESVLSKLASIKAEGLKELIEQQLYMEMLPKLPHQLKHVEILRVYVLLPLIPNFYSGGSTMLPIIYADRLQSLAPQLVSVVTRWIYHSPMEHLLRIIAVYKKTRDNGLRICLNFLSLLNSMNKSRMRISYHTFTIPQLASKVDIRMDYYNWLQRKTQSRAVFLCDFPFVFDAQAKTLLLQTDQLLQMQSAMSKAQTQLMSFFIFPQMVDPNEVQYLTLTVSRDSIVQDVMNQIYQLNTHDLKKPLKVKFIDEEAEDAGGVKKEFFLLLIREILDPKYGMFKHYEESRLIWFNEASFEDDVMYFLIGLLCGLAIYNLIIINIPFPLPLYKKLLNEKIELTDLKELSPREGKSLEQIMEYSEPDFEEVFQLNFELTREEFGAVKVVPLKPDGSNLPVTLENKSEFVDLYVSYVFNVSVNKQFDAFKKGFERVCGSTVLQLFHAQELQAMVTGNEDYDWGELERNCSYKGGYNVNESTIKIFWDVFHSLSLAEKKQFLLFLTGSDRIPILGMKTLKMCIQPTADERYLPVAHTCFNLLDLPRYQTRERLKYKLLQAIQQNQGFSLV
ncbi:putative E3 ubiquitin-protein ligase HERC4 [Orchesella cincta]|uniref:Putative E3 ubiquitin-protein ligase HERC4 n=1 Tax=Orchesella cincta TaxID=48709 RepID=A0A1D2NCR1_ORCCI|nr:putative E3 ubiquitin-protein ligase HERC4 [Orchesella cincta]